MTSCLGRLFDSAWPHAFLLQVFLTATNPSCLLLFANGFLSLIIAVTYVQMPSNILLGSDNCEQLTLSKSQERRKS